ncbi:acyl transferase/acyl hydrolase/lysophospholipase [Mycena epipterygia]|nr:acyl transferase/acyl hydrolase/lysophospholipase [Mycena epipterygia]
MLKRLAKHGPDSGVRVLSLDGGGAGVLSEFLMLERMMYRIQVEGHLDTEPSPCEFFELIGGSGTGGIIALMLGRLRMSVKDAISAYETLRPESKMGSAKKFKTRSFEETLKKIFKQEQMNDARPDACNTFVCAMNQHNMNARISHLFRSYNTADEPASTCMIWEAARATSATPELLKPIEIGCAGMKQHYIDGGVGNNNPTSLVLEEARILFPSRPTVLVCSMGSGHPDTIQMPIRKSKHADTIMKVLKNIATDCESIHEDNARKFRRIPNTYFRFNVEQGMQGLEAQHRGKSSEVSAHTNAYLRRTDTKSKLTEAVWVILTLMLDPAIPITNSPSYFKVCPPPTPHFTGRQDILQSMTTYFNTAMGRRHIFLLHGLGGSGKSQIAFKYVEMSTFPEPRFSEVYFIDSSTRQTIENDLVTLALSKQIGETAEASLLWLSHQYKEWLIIFNNADNIHLNLREFFPAGFHGNILVTSRNPALGQHAHAQCKVDQMDLEDATDLLLAAATCDPTILEYREIAKRIVQVSLFCYLKGFGLIL